MTAPAQRSGSDAIRLDLAEGPGRWLVAEFVAVLAFVLLGYASLIRFAWEQISAWS